VRRINTFEVKQGTLVKLKSLENIVSQRAFGIQRGPFEIEMSVARTHCTRCPRYPIGKMTHGSRSTGAASGWGRRWRMQEEERA
jgi:hypothetical protein